MGGILVTHKDLIIKFLEWPFLLFVFLFVLIIIFRRQIRTVLGRGDITISWGEGRSIKLRDISDHLDQELDQIREDIQVLKETLHNLQKGTSSFDEKAVVSKVLSEQERHDAAKRMIEALEDSKWRWRTLERLSIIAGITESEAIKILRGNHEVVLGQDKSGNHMARLRSR
jgi:hypothetical protein